MASSPRVRLPSRAVLLGIDPGTRSTGYGVIEVVAGVHRYVASGCVVATQGTLPERLGTIYQGLAGVIAAHRPTEVAIEDVFVAKNPRSALILGQARGAAISAAVAADLKVYEYAARQVKQAVVGTGRATKEQVQHMVQILLELSGRPQADAADALAIALCHSNTSAVPGSDINESSDLTSRSVTTASLTTRT